MAKKITVKCRGLLAVNKKYKVPWEDVYLSWIDKPGRTKYCLCPCLCSKKDLEYEHDIILKCMSRNPELDWSSDYNYSKSAIDQLKNNKIVVKNPFSKFPDIYTELESIDRSEAEKMITKLMQMYGFNSNIKYKWKRPKIVVISI